MNARDWFVESHKNEDWQVGGYLGTKSLRPQRSTSGDRDLGSTEIEERGVPFHTLRRTDAAHYHIDPLGRHS